MRKFKINCDATTSVSPGRFENTVDEEFLQDLSSMITLEDGSSLDLRKAVLLYNPKTREIQLSDSETYPPDFIQVAALDITDIQPEVSEDEPFEEFAEEMPEEQEEIPEVPEEPEAQEEDSMGETAGPEESADFFQ